MPPSRSNQTRPHLTLDEPSFQGLLSAAYTIQEHNDRRKQGAATAPEAAPEAAAEPVPVLQLCPRCGLPKRVGDATCEKCGLEELRPGERLQRNWASMWLMSQEQELWHEQPSEVDEESKKAALKNQKPVEFVPQTPRTFLPDPNGGGEWEVASSGSELREMEGEPFKPDFNLAGPAQELSDNDGFAVDDNDDEAPEISDAAQQPSMVQQFADWRVTLRFHRADLYLGIAIFVALTALLWPAATTPKKATLSPMDRILVKLGVAEAAAPTTHFRGDPAAQVWVDPHTALYYCAGEEQYGKTPDGRFSTQRDAEFDRFEPAGRSACE